jgi:hypothetical protein
MKQTIKILSIITSVLLLIVILLPIWIICQNHIHRQIAILESILTFIFIIFAILKYFLQILLTDKIISNYERINPKRKV